MAELLALPPAPSGSNNQSNPEAIPNSAAMHAKLVKADFHGSIIMGLFLSRRMPFRANRVDSTTEQERMSRRSLRHCHPRDRECV